MLSPFYILLFLIRYVNYTITLVYLESYLSVLDIIFYFIPVSYPNFLNKNLDP